MGAYHIAQIQGIRTLALGFNQIGDRGAFYLGQMQAMTYLDLTSNGIGDEGASYISNANQKLNDLVQYKDLTC